MHLGAKEVMQRHCVQLCWAQRSVSAMSAFYLAGYVLALRATFDGPILAGMQRMIDYLIARAGFYAQRILQLQHKVKTKQNLEKDKQSGS